MNRFLAAAVTTATLGFLVAVAGLSAAPPPAALELRNTGLAQLENERPAEAEPTFRELADLVEDDPLGPANLAIALLRQQKIDDALAAIATALDRSPRRPELLAIRAEILAWGGRPEEALQDFRDAAAGAPQDPELAYAVFRHAETLDSEAAATARREAVERLARLRPENLVVLLRLGAQAIADQDRATASGVYLRIRELLWGAPEIAERALALVLDALESGDLEAARVNGARLENVLKITPMFKSSLVELFTGIQGIPVDRFEDEPAPSDWGDPLDVELAAQRLAETPTPAAALVAVDLDDDGTVDLARLVEGEETRLEIRLAGRVAATTLPAPGLDRLRALDLDNDGWLDLIGHGADAPLRLWRGGEGGSFTEATAELGLSGVRARALAPIDFDSEGDLDLAVVLADGTLQLYRNALEGPLEAVGELAFPQLLPRQADTLLATDLDRDGDPDLVLVHEGGVTWLDNQRQGRFANRTAPAGLREVPASRDGISLDLDNDGRLDLVALHDDGLTLARGLGDGRFELEPLPLDAGTATGWRRLVPLDVDNDGRLDLALIGEADARVWRAEAADLRLPDGLGASGIAVADDDGDGDLDLFLAGPAGLHRVENRGGNRNHWLRVRLRGLTTGSDKNNVFGLGAATELRAGSAYQFREVDGPVTHFGLGRLDRPDLLRVVWNNGVPQNRLRPQGDTLVVEEQLLKGSCPFLYTWNGERIEFVTDLLWGAPLGMPLAPGVWNGFDPEELVRIDGAALRDGVLDLRITEELWEAAYFDRLRLWVVDHPDRVEVASNLRIVPGAAPGDPRLEDRILASRELRPVVAAFDGRGRDVVARVRARDDVYADGYPVGDYQGVAARPWSLTFDLGAAPGRPIRLHLDGWVFPADASLNLAVAQRTDLEWVFTRLEVETAAGWQTLLDPMGFPAGKTKTMVVDTPPLPAGARRLRIVSSRWLHWDRIAWTLEPSDDEIEIRRRSTPTHAELRYRGFSRLVRQAPNAPHDFDYHDVTLESPWLPVSGRFTRYGEVTELLEEVDDRFVLLAPGDEVAVLFDLADLPPPGPGRRRTFFLESHGYDKDADRNTWAGDTVEPLPFQGMSRYPFAEGESPPDTGHHRRYREEWLTREILPER